MMTSVGGGALARVRAAFAAVRVFSERERATALETRYGGNPGGVCGSAMDARIRDAAISCAGRERAVLDHVAKLIDEAATLIIDRNSGSMRQRDRGEALVQMACRITSLMHEWDGYGHELLTLRAVRSDSGNPLVAHLGQEGDALARGSS